MDNLENSESPKTAFTYSGSGVDIRHTDALKEGISGLISSDDTRVLNGLGPFASLYDIKFDDIKHPILVLKSEEPGSKQKLAIEYGFAESIGHDMVNHLVNDIAVMGATPLAVLDTIVCGAAENETITRLIKGIADACRENECSLVGGETSVQPGIVDTGTYILSSSIAGIIEKDKIIDGSRITQGDIVLAVASNGLHTNGYSLIRLLMSEIPQMVKENVGSETFIEAIMKPHTAYYKAIKGLAGRSGVSGMAHITGGGIEGNLRRVIPDGLCASVDLAQIKTLPIFRHIRERGSISDTEMLNTFNCGVGLILVVSSSAVDSVIKHVMKFHDCYPIGSILLGTSKISFRNNLLW